MAVHVASAFIATFSGGLMLVAQSAPGTIAEDPIGTIGSLSGAAVLATGLVYVVRAILTGRLVTRNTADLERKLMEMLEARDRGDRDIRAQLDGISRHLEEVRDVLRARPSP